MQTRGKDFCYDYAIILAMVDNVVRIVILLKCQFSNNFTYLFIIEMFLDANYIVFLTSIQTLQAASLTLSVPEENYDKITKSII